MKFTKERNYLHNKLKKLPRYTSFQEKEVLLLDEEESTLKDYLDVLLPNLPKNLKPINELEEIAYLFYLRSNSVSDLLTGIVECPGCKIINDYNIELDDLLDLKSYELEDSEYTNFPIGLFTDLNQIINNKDTDKLIIKDYNRLEEQMKKNNEKILNVHKDIICRNQKCKLKISISINPKLILSKLSLVGIYEEYMLLSYYSHNSKNDIDTMYPFERELLIGLLKKKIESQPQMGGLG
jgi:hypothetical protein